MFRIYIIALVSILFSTVISADDQTPFVRYPDINSDGSKIVFSYQGDIWAVSSIGGKADRLTIHEANDYRPLWSPDDNYIAFSSNRYHNYDLFRIPAEGGLPNRITYHSSNDILNDYTNKNNLIFSTARTYKQVERNSEISRVSDGGGTPELLIDALGAMPAISPDGNFIAFTNGWGRISREAYRGSANNDIYVYNIKNGIYKKLTDFTGHDFYPRWADSRTLFYISAESGIYNIHKLTIDDNGNILGNVTQITNYTDDGIQYINISGDGSKIVYERQTDIYLLNLTDGISKKVEIEISSDYRFDPVVHKTFSNKMTEYEVSPNGKYSAFVVRGEIFLTENDKEKKKTKNLTENPYRDQNITWLNDTSLVFISDRNGQQELYLIRSADKEESNLFKTLKLETIRLTDTPEDEANPLISPDLNKIAYTIGSGNLVVANIDKNGKLNNKTDILDGWANPNSMSWSPDSKWLAYSLADLYFNYEIFIHPIDNHISPVNISMHPRYDLSPVWSSDGSKLGFLSRRNSNNMIEINDYDVWFVWLNKQDWERTKDDWEEYEKPEDVKKEKEDEKEEKKKEVKTVEIDIENIYERLVQVTSLSGDENNIQFSKDGETFYFTSKSPTKKGSDIFSIKWDGTDTKDLTKDGANPTDVKISLDGKYLYFNQKGTLARLNIDNSKKESLPFQAKMDINFPLEKEQKFEEGWRALRDEFYDPNFHGQDWNKLKEKYKPWCLAASTENDFQYMYNLMLGQVNASHMGMYDLPPREDIQKEVTGLLGIRIKQVKTGVEVIHVINKSPADKNQSRLKIGDIITAVNGNKINNNISYYSLLKNVTNDKVLLEVVRDNEVEEIVIRPTSSLSDLLYDEWVDNNSKLVEKYSKGKLGYLHIKGMAWSSFERFEREFMARGYGKEGIVIDVRYNGGGWTTDFLMTVLNYKQHAYTIPRGAANNLLLEKNNFREYYPLGERLPYSAWIKPSIALCNQNSYSNAEIFSHAYKNLGIGKLVGIPTFGAVISTGQRTLIDGSYVRMPSRGWFVKSDNSNMDFVPAVPDIIVENPPNEKTDENDKQLKKAVEELLKEIK